MNKIVRTKGTCGGEYRIGNHRITVLDIISTVFADEEIQGILLKGYYPTLELEDLDSVKEFLISKVKNKEKSFALLNLYDDIEGEIPIYKGDKVIANRPSAEFGLIEGKEYKIVEINTLDLISIINEKGKKEMFSTEYFREVF